MDVIKIYRTDVQVFFITIMPLHSGGVVVLWAS